MIDRAEMMQAIVDACPGFAPTYDSFIAEWRDEPEIPFYIALGQYSRYLIEMLEAGDRTGLDAAFLMIEQLHNDGDNYVREAATIGILEDLQNTSLHTSSEPAQFVEYLRPTSTRYWQELNKFWGNGTASPRIDENFE